MWFCIKKNVIHKLIFSWIAIPQFVSVLFSFILPRCHWTKTKSCSVCQEKTIFFFFLFFSSLFRSAPTMLLRVPDRTFYFSRASKSADRRFWIAWNLTVSGFIGSEIVRVWSGRGHFSFTLQNLFHLSGQLRRQVCTFYYRDGWLAGYPLGRLAEHRKTDRTVCLPKL